MKLKLVMTRRNIDALNFILSLAQGELHAMHDSDKWRKKLGQEGLELLQEIFQLAKQGK